MSEIKSSETEAFLSPKRGGDDDAESKSMSETKTTNETGKQKKNETEGTTPSRNSSRHTFEPPKSGIRVTPLPTPVPSPGPSPPTSPKRGGAGAPSLGPTAGPASLPPDRQTSTEVRQALFEVLPQNTDAVRFNIGAPDDVDGDDDDDVETCPKSPDFRHDTIMASAGGAPKIQLQYLSSSMFEPPNPQKFVVTPSCDSLDPETLHLLNVKSPRPLGDSKGSSHEASQASALSDISMGSEGGCVPKCVRVEWDNKIQFMLAVIGYAVGLGNVWRFPYLCQKNGGGAFLIPYFLMLFVEGIPLFYLELAFGQRWRKGAIGAWGLVSRRLGGIGVASCVVSIYLALYYNTIIAWCFSYLFSSFQYPMPWDACPEAAADAAAEADAATANVTLPWRPEPECDLSSPTQFYWQRSTLATTGSISDFGQGWNFWLWGCVILAWIVVYACVIRGITSAGKVVYFTATFPYLVLVIFFFRGVTLPGFSDGIIHMFTPDFKKLVEPQVWLEAATQIFFSLGLSFGGVIAYASYMPLRNDCFRDAIVVSVTNCATSIFAGIVIFSILGFKAHKALDHCNHELEEFFQHQMIPFVFNEEGNVANASTLPLPGATYVATTNTTTNTTMNMTMPSVIPVQLVCDLKTELSTTASGTGLAFIAFTEAISQFGASAPFFAVLFFLMLLTLGLGSMIGTMEGVITSMIDMNLFPGVRKEFVSGGLCAILLLVAHIFVPGNGNYIVGFLDTFACPIPLLIIALLECIGVSYVYGVKKFSDDVELMTGRRPSLFWQICWKFASPGIMTTVLLACLVKMFMSRPTYEIWFYGADSNGVERASPLPDVPYPATFLVLAALLVAGAVLWIPLVGVGCLRMKEDKVLEEFPEEELRSERNIQDRKPSRFERKFLWPASSNTSEATPADV